MEKIDIRDCFPVMNGGDGVILSKRGDVCVGWEMSLPPTFRCNEEKYDSVLRTIHSAVALLPDYCILHKQDVYMSKKYSGEKVRGFLNEAYERHFDGRDYLDHRCRIFITMSNKNNVKGSPSGIAGFGAKRVPDNGQIERFLGAAEQFESVVRGNPLLGMKRLTEDEIFGDDRQPGIIQDYLNFTDGGEDILSDISVSGSHLNIGDKVVGCHLIADLDQLPAEVGSCRKVSSLSTDTSTVHLSFLYDIGLELDCEHIINTFILKEPVKDIYNSLDAKRRQMMSMSAKSAENRMFADEINDFLEQSAAEQMTTVKFHINILSGAKDISRVSDMVTASISKMGITPVIDKYDAACQFWASIPGNEAGMAYGEYMTMELMSALCIGIYDGCENGIKDGVMKMSDRIRLIPQRFDIQEKAYEMGLIENYNVFLLGPQEAESRSL